MTTRYMVTEGEYDRISLEDGEWIDIKPKLTVADYDRIDRETSADNTEGRILITLLLCIKRWSFKNKQGKAIPINETTVGQLTAEIAVQLFTEIGERNPAPKA